MQLQQTQLLAHPVPAPCPSPAPHSLTPRKQSWRRAASGYPTSGGRRTIEHTSAVIEHALLVWSNQVACAAALAALPPAAGQDAAPSKGNRSCLRGSAESKAHRITLVLILLLCCHFPVSKLPVCLPFDCALHCLPRLSLLFAAPCACPPVRRALVVHATRLEP